MMRSADDADAISKRIAELRQEETAQRNAGCDCPDDVREDGKTIKVHWTDCRHYTAPTPLCGLAPLQQRPLDDDWETLKRQAQSPEAKFPQRLRLCVDRSNRRAVLIVNPANKSQWVVVMVP
jgi:hypothetical protein